MKMKWKPNYKTKTKNKNEKCICLQLLAGARAGSSWRVRSPLRSRNPKLAIERFKNERAEFLPNNKNMKWETLIE